MSDGRLLPHGATRARKCHCRAARGCYLNCREMQTSVPDGQCHELQMQSMPSPHPNDPLFLSHDSLIVVNSTLSPKHPGTMMSIQNIAQINSKFYLHNVRSMWTVVISICVMVMWLDNNQPWSECHFVAIKCVVDIKATKEFTSNVQQGMLFRQLFESENFKVPIEGTLEELRNMRWHFQFWTCCARAWLTTSRSNYWFIWAAPRWNDIRWILL